MMLIEEQRSEPIRVSCNPEPLDTTTQERLYSENLNYLIDNMYFLSLEGKKINNSDLFDLLGEVFSRIAKTPSQIVSLKEEYAKILQEKNMEVARENTFKFVDELLNLGADDRVCNIILKQQVFHFLLSEYYNVTKTGKLLEEDDLKVVLSTILRVSDEEVNMYYSRYQRILKEEDIGVARGNAVKFIGDLRGLGADEKVCTIFSKQFGLNFLLNEFYNATNTGKCLKDDDVKLLFNMIPGISAKKSDEIYQCYQRVLQEENMEVARENTFKFIGKLSSLGAYERVSRIILKQIGLDLLLNEYCNATDTGKCLKDDDIKTVLNMIPEISVEESDDLYQRYQRVVQEEDMEVARENAVNFIGELKILVVDYEVRTIFSNQFNSCSLLKEYDNTAKTGKLLKDADIKAVLNTILRVSDEEADRLCQRYQQFLQEKDMEVARKNASDFIDQLKSLRANDKVCVIFSSQFDSCLLLNEYYNAANIGEYLEDDDIKTVLDMIPGIFAEKRDELYQCYQRILQEKNMEVARKDASDFIDQLKSLGADDRVCRIIFNQFSYYFDFLAEYYNNKQVADTASIMKLLNKIPGVSSKDIDKLYEEYKNIVNKKDRDGAVDFIKKLRDIGANESICDIIQREFCKVGIILPAEVRPSISGNLFVPGDAEFKKRYEYGGKFISELCLGNVNPAARPLEEELVEYFREEVIKPFEECQRILPTCIKQLLNDEKPSTEPKEKLRGMLDILTSGSINDAFKKSLEIVKRFSKELVSEGNRKNDRKLKEFVPDSSIDSIRSHLFTELKSQLPSEEDFRVIKECIAIFYESEGRVHASAGLKRSIFTRTPFYAGENFMVQLYELVSALTLSKEPLFPHDPCLDDIKQGDIGDCYLLASIASLLNSYGPDFIRNMMIDNGDGTVTVRLHAQSQREYDEDKSHVKYVKVYKSGLINNPNSAFWVQIIEKAYISIGANLYIERKEDELEGIVGYYKNYKKSYPRAVEDLEGGYEKNAFIVLAGVKCDEFFDSNFDEEKIKRAISQKLPLVCSFKSDFSFNGSDFLGGHAYSILGVVKKGSVTIVKLADPHDAGKVLCLPLEEWKYHIYYYTIADTDSQTEGMGS